MRIQRSGREYDVDVGGVGGGGGHQAARILDAGLAQDRFLGGIANNRVELFAVALRLGFVLLDHQKGRRLARQLAGGAAAYPAYAADYEMIGEPADLAFHAAPAEEVTQLEF